MPNWNDLPTGPVDYSVIEQAYNECSLGEAEPIYAVLGRNMARVSDLRQARRLARQGWFRSTKRCEGRGRTLMIHPKFVHGVINTA